jgi:hypothetical protein
MLLVNNSSTCVAHREKGLPIQALFPTLIGGFLSLSRSTQQRIFQRDGFRCQICQNIFPPVYEIPKASRSMKNGGPEFLIVDHIKSTLGNADENLQSLCWRCNVKKSGRNMFTAQVMRAMQCLGHPVLSYPAITEALGGNASIFVAQLLYWTPRSNRWDNRDGWIFKTSEQTKEETGLSYKEQATARARLVDAKMIEERYDRENHRMEFRVIPDGLSRFFGHLPDEHMPNEHMPKAEVAPPQQGEGTAPTGVSYKEIETTAENTHIGVLQLIEDYHKGKTHLDEHGKKYKISPSSRERIYVS